MILTTEPFLTASNSSSVRIFFCKSSLLSLIFTLSESSPSTSTVGVTTITLRSFIALVSFDVSESKDSCVALASLSCVSSALTSLTAFLNASTDSLVYFDVSPLKISSASLTLALRAVASPLFTRAAIAASIASALASITLCPSCVVNTFLASAAASERALILSVVYLAASVALLITASAFSISAFNAESSLTLRKLPRLSVPSSFLLTLPIPPLT